MFINCIHFMRAWYDIGWINRAYALSKVEREKEKKTKKRKKKLKIDVEPLGKGYCESSIEQKWTKNEVTKKSLKFFSPEDSKSEINFNAGHSRILFSNLKFFADKLSGIR